LVIKKGVAAVLLLPDVKNKIKKSLRLDWQVNERQSQISRIPKEDDEVKISVTKAWKAFGEYIAKKMKIPTAIYVPKFGIFTFTGGKPNFVIFKSVLGMIFRR
jgi:hypothetical protein